MSLGILIGVSAASTNLHAFTVLDNSTGNTPRVSILPGTFGGIVPTINGTPMNQKIGTPPAFPILTVGMSDTTLYFAISYSIYGAVNSVSIQKGSSMPSATIVPGLAGTDYKILSTFSIKTTGSLVTVLPNNDGVSGPQAYSQCGNYSNAWLV
jgi:hypothetical protein